jgi:hypothetical protein
MKKLCSAITAAIFIPALAICQRSELFDIAQLPVLKTGVQYEMQSSYDRSGGNDDGFSGKYSILRKENGKSVISEIKGKGIITRIWFPSNPDYPEGPMGLRNKRIYVYLDGNSTPVIDLPIIQLFNNSDPRFPYPLCGMGLGGCWSYAPIAFNNGATIMVEGDSARFFQVQYTKYENSIPLKTYDPAQSPAIPGYRWLSDAMWHPGDISKLVDNNANTKAIAYSLKAGKNNIAFPKGPSLLRGILVKASPDDLEIFLKGNLSITWDNESKPAVQTPLSMFFIREKDGLAGRSLLAGSLPGGEGVYNFFPMPYLNKANVQLTVPKNCKVEITTVTEQPASIAGMGYLHISYAKDQPTVPGKKHVFAEINGNGHYAGTYLRAAGPSLSDTAGGRTIYWTGALEGDEVFEADGREVEHGTGTEDYFNAGWNGLQQRLDRPGIYPLTGYTLFDAGKKESRNAAYRWRMPGEVVPFNKHFKASIEVGPGDDVKGKYESISYYYLKMPGN